MNENLDVIRNKYSFLDNIKVEKTDKVKNKKIKPIKEESKETRKKIHSYFKTISDNLTTNLNNILKQIEEKQNDKIQIN